MAYAVEKTDEEWREELSPEEYAVLRKAGTERAFTGEYTDTETKGVYRCKACQAKLFESDTKFHSGCGWPSFYQPITDTVEYIEDTTLGMKRVEVRCANCGSHLGHVFPDGYGTPTGDRYCINSISLTLEPADPAELSRLARVDQRRGDEHHAGTVRRVGPVLQRAVVVVDVDEHVAVGALAAVRAEHAGQVLELGRRSAPARASAYVRGGGRAWASGVGIAGS